MSKTSVSHPRGIVNSESRRPKRFDRFAGPSPQERSDLWHELLARESLAPDALRGGIARARTKLLDGVPAWRLPEFLDSLGKGGAA